MTWVRFEDLTPEHPKLASLGSYTPLCGWLWFAACCYCMRHLTDGVISHDALRALWPYRHIGVATGGVPGLFDVGDDPTPDDLISLLVACGLLERKRNGCYRVHDFLDYNPSRVEVLELREKKKKAGQAGGQASAQASGRARATPSATPSGSEVPNPPTPIEREKEGSKPPTSEVSTKRAGETTVDRLAHGILTNSAGTPKTEAEDELRLRRLRGQG